MAHKIPLKYKLFDLFWWRDYFKKINLGAADEEKFITGLLFCNFVVAMR